MSWSSSQKVEININPDGNTEERPAPSLGEMVSKLKPAPDSRADAPVMESDTDALMRQLKAAIPGMNLNLKRDEMDIQQMLLNQLKREEDATERARRVPRPTSSISLSASELARHDGSDPDLPIFLSIRRKLYDVTDGVKYYGKEGKYNYLVGHEVGRAMATGCFESTGLTWDVRGLSQNQLETVAAWQTFYGKKYRHVGYLKGKKVEGEPLPDDDCPEASKYAGRPEV